MSIFEYPTLGKLAALIEKLSSQQDSEGGGIREESVPFHPSAVPDTDYPLSFTQESLWFLSRTSEAINTAYNINIAFRVLSSLDVEGKMIGIVINIQSPTLHIANHKA